MYVTEEKRQELDAITDFQQITQSIERRAGQRFPTEALILDQDLPAQGLVPELRARALRYDGGNPGFAKYNRVQIIHASHIFDSTEDGPLLRWCNRQEYPLLTCNVQDFRHLHQTTQHWGLIISLDQPFAHNQPVQFTDKVESIVTGHRKHEMQNRLFAVQS
jgi:hypothetical protein